MIVETLNGNLILKPEHKVKFNDMIELEIYAETLEDAKKQFREHKVELKTYANKQYYKHI